MLKVEVVTKSSYSRFFTQAVFKFHLKKKATPPRVPIPKSEFNLSLSYINVLKNGSANPTPHHPGRGWGVEVRTMTQISSFNYCKIFKNTFFHRTPLVAASDIQACKFIKKRFQHNSFPANIAKFLKTAFLKCFSFLVAASATILNAKLPWGSSVCNDNDHNNKCIHCSCWFVQSQHPSWHLLA